MPPLFHVRPMGGVQTVTTSLRRAANVHPAPRVFTNDGTRRRRRLHAGWGARRAGRPRTARPARASGRGGRSWPRRRGARTSRSETLATGARLVIDHPVPGREIIIDGPVSARTSDRVRTAWHTALACGDGDLVVHLANAQVWDAAGLGVVVGAHHRAERLGRRLVVADASPRLCRLLAGTRLDRVMNVSGACGYVPLARTA